MKHIYAIVYSILLISFTGYFIYDTFLQTNSYEVIEEKEEVNKDYEIITEPVVIKTDEYYKDENIEINIIKTREYETDIYIADIKLSDIKYLKTAFAKDTYGKNIAEFTSDIAERKNAILAINGDFYGVQQRGFVLKNYIVYRSSSRGKEDLIINRDGTFDTIKENSTNINNLTDVKELFCFGPTLIKNKEIKVTKYSKVYREKTSNPRTAIAVIEPLHYLFLVSDGRTDESEGLSLYELALVLSKYNVDLAYNLDGGGSSTLYYNGIVLNNPINKHKLVERKVSDIVYIGY